MHFAERGEGPTARPSGRAAELEAGAAQHTPGPVRGSLRLAPRPSPPLPEFPFGSFILPGIFSGRNQEARDWPDGVRCPAPLARSAGVRRREGRATVFRSLEGGWHPAPLAGLRGRPGPPRRSRARKRVIGKPAGSHARSLWRRRHAIRRGPPLLHVPAPLAAAAASVRFVQGCAGPGPPFWEGAGS